MSVIRYWASFPKRGLLTVLIVRLYPNFRVLRRTITESPYVLFAESPYVSLTDIVSFIGHFWIACIPRKLRDLIRGLSN